MKSSNSVGRGKELCVTTSNWTVNGVPYTSYGYTFLDEKFERPVKTAYKVTLHDKSYRNDKGKVTKKQYHVMTIKYYDLVDYGWYDCFAHNKIDDIAIEMGIDSESIWAELENKLDALDNKVMAEFAKTEEYAAKQKQDTILQEYETRRHEFAEKYGIQESEYNRCYDIFGVLRNPGYLEKIKRESTARKEYEERSSSYQRDYQSNYNNYSGSRTSSFNSGFSAEKEKEYYKKFYKTLATKYHPDASGDNEIMQFLNKLKGQWGI